MITILDKKYIFTLIQLKYNKILNLLYVAAFFMYQRFLQLTGVFLLLIFNKQKYEYWCRFFYFLRNKIKTEELWYENKCKTVHISNHIGYYYTLKIGAYTM